VLRRLFGVGTNANERQRKTLIINILNKKKTMKENFNKDILNDARRLIGHKREQMEEEARMWKDFQQLADAVEEFRRENDDLNEELAQLQFQYMAERDARAAAEMRLSELTKLADGVAKKSSDEGLIKALRTFTNNSKRKKLEKRTAVKEIMQELVLSCGVELPQDLADSIQSLDDEQQEAPKLVVNVSGDYNDIHDNNKVDIKKEEAV